MFLRRGRELTASRPERVDVELRMTCSEADILKQDIFRIFAHVKGVKDAIGNALIGVNNSKDKPVFHLGNLTVESKYQGRGVSSQIMDKFESIITKHGGIGTLGDAIKNDSKAVGMYKKRGWREDGNRMIFP